jgi:hypothetical protein
LYENALKKMNLLLSQTEKQLQVEKDSRVKNEEYKKLYYEMEEKCGNMMKTFESERTKREELEIIHTRNEAKLLQIIRDKEAEVLRLKNENKALRLKIEKKEPCSSCINILSEFQGLKAKNESVLQEISKKSPNKPNFSPEGSGLYVPQSPSFDKSLDKSIDRHQQINNQLKVSRSESELLKLIDEKKSSTERNDPKLSSLKFDLEGEEEVPIPTFRGQENSFSMQRNLKTSIADIKARINTLNSNRSELQSKMEELENKLLKSTQRYYV